MQLSQIVQFTNDKLAGELLTFDLLKVHLDSVIDDINNELNAKFPAFSEFNVNDHPQYPDYNFFPNKYIRNVVTLGAAYKFFITDEEGINTAVQYAKDYALALFMMKRDYMALVPEAYQDNDSVGSIMGVENMTLPYDNTGW